MAYMTKDGKGPHPNKAGEYYGNHRKGSQYCTDEATLAIVRFGRPRPCKAGTTEEMEKRGLVGLYLKEDQKLGPDDVEIPTPPELMEPAD